jgi:hypothetical protein
VSFVADGRIWAVSPDDRHSLHCLFEQPDAGVFSWGPRGDRVLLAGLQVRGVASPAARPAGSFRPSYFTWSRPTGTTVWYTDQARSRIFRADIGVATVMEITPLPGVTYGDMAYHPSGLAVGFVASDASGTGLWMSTNLGASPRLLVRAPPGTSFGHIAFAHDGTGLYYSVDGTGGTHSLARYDLAAGTVAENLWTGTAPVAGDIVELAGAPGVALTVGASCAQRRAVFSALDGTAGTVLSVDEPGPASVVGRLDADRFVVAGGGCGAPLDLHVVRMAGGTSTVLVRSVSAAALRLPEPTPPPPLPKNLPTSGFA